MAADCSDSLAAQIVCCQADNGLTHGELTPSLFTVQLLAVLIGFLFDSFVPMFWWRQHSLLMIAPSSCIFPFFFVSVGISSFLLLCFSTRFLTIANSWAGFHSIDVLTQPTFS